VDNTGAVDWPGRHRRSRGGSADRLCQSCCSGAHDPGRFHVDLPVICPCGLFGLRSARP